MTEYSRRRILITGGAAAGLAAVPGTAVADSGCEPPPGPVTAGPEDPRYPSLVRRGNRRFVGTPDYVRVVGSTEQVVRAVQEAVRAGKRIAVRSGGHCFENFVDDPAVRVVIDLSGMTEVCFDSGRNAFAVEAGATLGEVYRRLFLGWGVTIPAGWCPGVGVGGHVAGGGYGTLSRSLGLVVDHLYAVEVVVVDRSGVARSVIATREHSDPNRELWWAHTGGGGGNFGVVTRYWFSSPGATGGPDRLLPAPPASVLNFSYEIPWEGMGETQFARLVRNHGEWCARNSAPDSPAARYYAEVYLYRRSFGKHLVIGQASGPDAERLLNEHAAALGVTPENLVKEWQPWLTAALQGTGEDGKQYRLKIKAGYLRQGFSDRQIAAIYHHLTRDDYANPGASLGLNTYGGQVNAVRPDATAVAHRDAIIKLFYLVAWQDPAQDAEHIRWLREFYRDVYAETGGVPAPEDGSYISYPDVDLADPEWNTSGVPWSTLYYKGNYPRLRQIKARWDPHDVFRHALSIRPAEIV